MKHAFLVSLLLVSSAVYSNPPDQTKISEGLTTDEVQGVVKANLNKVRHCYEELLKKSPKAKGTVAVEFTISSEGKVGNSKLSKDTVGNKEMGDCVLKTINQWTFPKPKGGKSVEVSYPFQFDPN